LKTWPASWLFWALLSAIFAAITAIFAKIGAANINSDLATLFRSVVIAVILARLRSPNASRRSTSFRLFSLLASAPHFWARDSRRRISPPSPDGCGALLLIANLKITVAKNGQTS
jgi:hypothetical protein